MNSAYWTPSPTNTAVPVLHRSPSALTMGRLQRWTSGSRGQQAPPAEGPLPPASSPAPASSTSSLQLRLHSLSSLLEYFFHRFSGFADAVQCLLHFALSNLWLTNWTLEILRTPVSFLWPLEPSATNSVALKQGKFNLMILGPKVWMQLDGLLRFTGCLQDNVPSGGHL